MASSFTFSWPKAEILSVMVFPQFIQISVRSPSSVQVASFVISFSVQLCSIGGISCCV